MREPYSGGGSDDSTPTDGNKIEGSIHGQHDGEEIEGTVHGQHAGNESDYEYSGDDDSGDSGSFFGRVSNTIDEFQESADKEIRERTGGKVGISQDWTSRDDSGGVRNVVDEATDPVEKTANETSDRVGDRVDDVRQKSSEAIDASVDTATDVKRRVTGSVDDVRSGVSDRVDNFQDTADEKLRDATDGKVGVSDDFTSREDSGGVRNVADRGVRTATGGEVGVSDDFTSTDDWFDNAEFDRELATDLSRGGVLSEDADDNSGLLPGEVVGFDISEDRLRSGSEWVEGYKDRFDENEDVTIAGSDVPERVLEGAAGMGVDILNVPQHVLTAEGAVETAQNTPGALADDPSSFAQTATIFGRDAGQAMVDEAQENPVEFASGAAFGYVTGAAAGRAVGQAGRVARDRYRTAGGERIDPEDLADPDVIRHADTDGAEGQLFPDADNPDLYKTDPAEAVRRQADEYTPETIDEFFADQGVGEGTTLTKALKTEPDGPGTGRSDTGFTSAPDEVDGNFDYETPGSFFGPELSPNFLRIDGGDASFSFRPGLPDFGNRPTGVLARTDVENPDTDNLQAFNQELMDNVGDTTAYTKPADEVNVGEIEAVVPPGAEFAPIRSGGPATDLARRAGYGADFYTEVGGRRVPLRTVAPADRTPDADGGSGGLFGERGGSGESFDYYVESPGEPVDRPLPLGVPGGAGGSGADGQAETQDSEPPSAYDEPPEMDVFGGSPVDEGGSGPSSPGAGPDGDDRTSPPSSPPADEPSSPPSSDPFDGAPPSSGPPSSDPPERSPPGSSPPDNSTPGGSPPASDPPGYEPPSYTPPGSPPGSPPPTTDDSEPTPPGSPSDSPYGGYGPFGGTPGDSPPAQSQSRPIGGGVEGQDDRDRRDEEVLEPETPEFFNPIASGTEDIFGGGTGESAEGGEDGGNPLFF